MNAMPPNARLMAKAFNKTIGIVKAPIEQVNAGIKENAVPGDKSKLLFSLATNAAKAKMFIEAAIGTYFMLMRMRGQIYGSNLEVVSHCFDGIDLVQKTLNEHLYTERLLSTRKNYYFGPSMNGADYIAPPVIPF